MLGGARGNYINLVFSCDKSAESVNNKVLIESVTVEKTTMTRPTANMPSVSEIQLPVQTQLCPVTQLHQ